MQNYAKSVATEILRQLGGNRFIVMTGAKVFLTLMKTVSVG